MKEITLNRDEEIRIKIKDTDLVVIVSWSNHHLQALITDEKGFVADDNGVNC